ncbi:Hypothetical protein CINCED_3A018143 [Cinara cedri]|uniref:Uncharacterized protein n=1 Tax=Cinara cedri TaxID=506608 RepID=A0A5E4MZX3_9HEMI|nr:Hypothetical protein CINCED_3A018143 [Cinara cedri]
MVTHDHTVVTQLAVFAAETHILLHAVPNQEMVLPNARATIQPISIVDATRDINIETSN